MSEPFGYFLDFPDKDYLVCANCHKIRYGDDDQGHESITIAHLFDCDDCGECIR